MALRQVIKTLTTVGLACVLIGCGQSDSTADENPGGEATSVTPDTGGDAVDAPEQDAPPDSWLGTAEQYEDDACDCGLGARDPGCGENGCTEPGCVSAWCDTCVDAQGEPTSCRGGSGSDDDDGNGADGEPGDSGGGGDDSGGGSSTAPAGWTCSEFYYGDGDCDCGCGVIDSDCSDGCAEAGCFAAVCDFCFESGGIMGQCEAPPPADWSCDAERYEDGEICDCGCGLADPDCGQAEGCTEPGCQADACNHCTDTDGAPASCAGEVPSGWSCDPLAYGDGTCTCGCGVTDVDCEAADAGGDNPQGCTEAGCWAEVCETCYDGNGFGECLQPAPDGWTCDRYAFFDDLCTCGCGYKDPQCDGAGCFEPGCRASACESCRDNVGEYTRCDAPAPPSGWTCSDDWYNDDECQCGCGIKDPSCDGAGCTEAGCSASACTAIKPPEGWSCEAAAYNDAACDCGCGIADPTCAGSGCTEPACNAEACETTTAPSGWSCNDRWYSDEDCDCGCGVADPECAGAGCSTPGCTTEACDWCFDGAGNLSTCD